MKCEVCTKFFESCDTHHIQSLSYGGSNKPFNKATLCPNCHRLVHKGLVILEGRFMSSGGNILVWRTYKTKSITGVEDPKVYIMDKGLVV